MTDATLRQAILDDPDDIAARRVDADALIAEGSPRGELINVQCAFEDAVPTERGALLKRETALLKANVKTWMAPYGRAIFRPEFRRGFLEHAYVNTKKFIPVAPALLDAEPITTLHLRELSVPNAISLGQVCPGSPGSARCVSPRASSRPRGPRLFANPMPRLTTLNLYQAGIDDGGFEPLAGLFPQLERLNLAGTRVTYDGLATLLADPNLAVRYLHLNWLVPMARDARRESSRYQTSRTSTCRPPTSRRTISRTSPATRCFAACAGCASSITTSSVPRRSRRSRR